MDKIPNSIIGSEAKRCWIKYPKAQVKLLISLMPMCCWEVTRIAKPSPKRDNPDSESARKPRKLREDIKTDGTVKARIVAPACSEPPLGQSRWA